MKEAEAKSQQKFISNCKNLLKMYNQKKKDAVMDNLI